MFHHIHNFSIFIYSLKQLQHTVDKVDEIALALYRKILDEVSTVGARVVKIIFKPSCDSTARLMENGDFRIKFQDGMPSKYICSSKRVNRTFSSLYLLYFLHDHDVM